MLRNLLIFIVLLLSAFSLAGQDSFHLARTLPLAARFATADHLGNLYLITPANAVERYAPDGRLLARYTNNRLGPAAALDVSNPLKVLVWFGDFRTAVFLDRSLTLLGELNLIEAGFPEVRTIALAADGNVWVYDETAFKLRKITPEGSPLQESQELNLLLPHRVQISCLRDDGSRVVAADTLQGLLVFDAYAQFSTLLPLPGVHDFQLVNDAVVFLSGEALQRQSLRRSAEAGSRPLPAAALQPGRQLWLAPGRLLLQQAEVITVFEF